jgi:hypothetical protein
MGKAQLSRVNSILRSYSSSALPHIRSPIFEQDG